MNPTLDIVIFLVIASFVITLLLTLIESIFEESANKYLYFCIFEFSLLVTVVNVWYSDILTFSECICFDAIGLLFCFLSVYIFARKNSLVNYIVSSVLFVGAAACFQQFISVFSIYTILILCIKQVQSEKKRIKELVFFYVKPCIFIIVNSAIYYFVGVLLQKAFNVAPNSRASMSIKTIIDNSIYFIKNQHSFLKGKGFFSTEILTICYLAVAVIFVISLVMFWRKTRQTAKTIFIGLSFMAAYVAAYLPGLVSTSHGTRTICALFSVFALFAIGAVALYKNKVLSIVLACILILVFALNIYKTVDMGINQIIGNTKEAEYADSVAYTIEKYEKKNKVAVDNIGITYDKHSDAEGEALYLDYAIKPLLQIHISNDICFVETPEGIVNTYFSEKDWQNFDAEEQIVFDNNTAYICIY